MKSEIECVQYFNFVLAQGQYKKSTFTFLHILNSDEIN